MQYTLIDLGLIEYNKAYVFQRECVDKVKSGAASGFLVFCEHYPVFTLGRFAKEANLLVTEELARAKGADIIKTDRGGDITFHGPGQIITYPIFDLNRGRKDVHVFLRDLEEVVIRTLSDFGIYSFRSPGRTGAWTEQGKIASIGIGITKWITFHGLCLNVNADLKYFDMINPCGFSGIRTASMHEILKKCVDQGAVKEALAHNFSEVFDIDLGLKYSDNMAAI